MKLFRRLASGLILILLIPFKLVVFGFVVVGGFRACGLNRRKWKEFFAAFVEGASAGVDMENHWVETGEFPDQEDLF